MSKRAIIALAAGAALFALVLAVTAQQQAKGSQMKADSSKLKAQTSSKLAAAAKQSVAPKVHADTSLVAVGRQPDEVFVYRKTPQGELKIHFYFPPDWKKTDKRPVTVFFFGGGWRIGGVGQFFSKCEYLAGRGMVAASAAYRIKTKHKTSPDKCVEDAKSAIRWVRKNAARLGVDPSKLIASGGSAGGHLAAAAAACPGLDAPDDDLTVSCKPDALVLFNPATDLRMERIVAMMGGESEEQRTKMAEMISPVRYLKKGDPPAIVFYGTKDWMLGTGRQYVEKYLELGNRAELWTARSQPHGFFNKTPWHEATMQKTDEFLASLGYLSGPATIKPPAKQGALTKDLPKSP